MVKSDLHELHKKLKAEPVILIGTLKGRFISRAEGIPLVRAGFPVEDCFGYHRRAIVGYRGGTYPEDGKASHRDVVSNTLLEGEEQKGDVKTSCFFLIDGVFSYKNASQRHRLPSI